jgi:hypothetical protein
MKTPKTPKDTPDAGKPSVSEGFRGKVSLSLLFDAPELAAIPTLWQAAELEPEGTAAADALRLLNSLEKHGQIEALKVTRGEAGRWAVWDGRSRRGGLQNLTDNGIPDRDMAEVKEITAEEANNMALETLKRRHVPDYVLAYIRCLQHEGGLVSKKGGRRSKDSLDDTPTQEGLAAELGIRVATVNACVAAMRIFAERPASREELEPKILAGLLDPVRVPHAVTGAEATKGQTRRPSSYESWLPKLKSFGSTARTFDKWTPGDKKNAARALAEDAKAWPQEFRELLAGVLNTEPEGAV